MKKIVLILILVLSIVLSSCSFLVPSDEVLDSMGEYVKKEEGINAGARDVTIYFKYFYDDVDLENNAYLKQVTDADIAALNTYIDNFEKWVKCVEEADTYNFYDFTWEIVDDQDYLCICDNSDDDIDMEDYAIYFFDSQTKILYYFRNTM